MFSSQSGQNRPKAATFDHPLGRGAAPSLSAGGQRRAFHFPANRRNENAQHSLLGVASDWASNISTQVLGGQARGGRCKCSDLIGHVHRSLPLPHLNLPQQTGEEARGRQTWGQQESSLWGSSRRPRREGVPGALGRSPALRQDFGLFQHRLRCLLLLVGRVAVLAEDAADQPAQVCADVLAQRPVDGDVVRGRSRPVRGRWCAASRRRAPARRCRSSPARRRRPVHRLTGPVARRGRWPPASPSQARSAPR